MVVDSRVVSGILHKDKPEKGEAEHTAFPPAIMDGVDLADSGCPRSNSLLVIGSTTRRGAQLRATARCACPSRTFIFVEELLRNGWQRSEFGAAQKQLLASWKFEGPGDADKSITQVQRRDD
jgi:hypothetical protein